MFGSKMNHVIVKSEYRCIFPILFRTRVHGEDFGFGIPEGIAVSVGWFVEGDDVAGTEGFEMGYRGWIFVRIA